MTFLDHVKRFKLYILNEEFYFKHIRDSSPFDGLFEIKVWRELPIPLDLDHLMKEKILLGDWKSFKDGIFIIMNTKYSGELEGILRQV
tara:strand:+ start:1092 stop:1355 length:264 start_codon:yes stop_codon:yes gene_type:complete